MDGRTLRLQQERDNFTSSIVTTIDLRFTARLTHSTIFNRYLVAFPIGMVENL
jgi:hypothetical protein